MGAARPGNGVQPEEACRRRSGNKPLLSSPQRRTENAQAPHGLGGKGSNDPSYRRSASIMPADRNGDMTHVVDELPAPRSPVMEGRLAPCFRGDILVISLPTTPNAALASGARCLLISV